MSDIADRLARELELVKAIFGSALAVLPQRDKSAVWPKNGEGARLPEHFEESSRRVAELLTEEVPRDNDGARDFHRAFQAEFDRLRSALIAIDEILLNETRLQPSRLRSWQRDEYPSAHAEAVVRLDGMKHEAERFRWQEKSRQSGPPAADVQSGSDGDDPPAQPKPSWNGDRSELSYDGSVVRTIRPTAHACLILAAFQEEGWPDRIDSPLSADVDLSATLRTLNNRLRRLRFRRDGRRCHLGSVMQVARMYHPSPNAAANKIVAWKSHRKSPKRPLCWSGCRQRK